MTSRLVVDAVEQAIWTRGRESNDLAGLIAHHDHGVQYKSVAYSERLDAAGITRSTGAVGSSYDNALAESLIGLYKTELVKPRRPSKGFDDLEIATAGWVDWFNHRRPFEYCDDLTQTVLEFLSIIDTILIGSPSTDRGTPPIGGRVNPARQAAASASRSFSMPE